jgi:leader peptidase (prepilin peptidase)/N-methyltransferase
LTVLELLANEPVAFLICAGVVSLLVGSFLNVVILRLPLMLEQAWKFSAAEILEQPVSQPEDKISLVATRSACPKCGAKIPGWHNIPVVSYLLLRGRCAACKAGISLQYPLVEILTAALSVVVAWHYGYGMAACLAIVFTWALIAATGVDWRTQFLPDVITLPLMWLGLLASLTGSFATPQDAIIGAAGGYLLLWGVFHAFRLITGKEGMGYGDFKLLAALGAWMGWQMLPLIIILSSVAGMVIGIGMNMTGALKRGNPMPFGPFLAIAGWLALIAGDTIVSTYLQFAGLG